MMSIAERWTRFRVSVISPNAPAIQLVEMRLAFYAGCWEMLQAGLEIAEIEDDSECVRAINAFHQETMNFAAQVGGFGQVTEG